MKQSEFKKRLSAINAKAKDGDYRLACRLANRTINEWESELSFSQKKELETLSNVFFRKAMN